MLRTLLIARFGDGEAGGGPAEDAALGELAREFPTVQVVSDDGVTPAPELDEGWWRSERFDPYAADAWVGDAAALPMPPALRLRAASGRSWPETAGQVLTRFQGLIQRRNAASEGPGFDAVLLRHRAIHDLSRPLVRADYCHALDVWQWLLRLSPEASGALQLAALFHDVERLVSEPDRRFEHHAEDYAAFKAAHARRGAELVRSLLQARVDAATLDAACALVREHEAPGDDPQLQALNDADALSFFSLNSAGFLDYYGEAHTRRKIDYSLRRMRPAARARITHLRLRPDVERLLAGVLGVPEAHHRTGDRP